MPWELNTTRGWWLLLRDVLLFILGAVVWINELLISTASADPVALAAGATAMALPFAWRQDEQKKG